MSQEFINEASLTGTMRVIIILIIIYACYSLLVRFIIPTVIKKSLRNFQEKFYEENPDLRKEDNLKKEGEISIRRIDDRKARQLYNEAEDTEYEEIK
ncbi:MAG TPA: hypothetical protein PLJ84_00590 [Bacteroidales bacterium]|nr:hypothetical protein [Bacteroidales bacterium]HPT01067.1 hypothetical protein [Bacteroidales bacterium]